MTEPSSALAVSTSKAKKSGSSPWGGGDDGVPAAAGAPPVEPSGEPVSLAGPVSAEPLPVAEGPSPSSGTVTPGVAFPAAAASASAVGESSSSSSARAAGSVAAVTRAEGRSPPRSNRPGSSRPGAVRDAPAAASESDAEASATSVLRVRAMRCTDADGGESRDTRTMAPERRKSRTCMPTSLAAHPHVTGVTVLRECDSSLIMVWRRKVHTFFDPGMPVRQGGGPGANLSTVARPGHPSRSPSP